MPQRLLPLALFASCAALIGLWCLSRTAHAVAMPPGNETIAKSMQQMNDALEALSKGITAANREAALEELAKFESAVIGAKAAVPASATKVDEKKRAAFVADYRKTLIDALDFAAAAERAVIDGKYKDADTLVRNKLGGLKSTGHGKFKTEGGK